MEERLQRDVPESDRGQWWFSTYLLLGLKYDRDIAHQLLRGVRDMEESTTYQYHKAKFRAEGKMEGKHEGYLEKARKILLRLGTNLLGEPTARKKGWREAVTLASSREGVPSVGQTFLSVPRTGSRHSSVVSKFQQVLRCWWGRPSCLLQFLGQTGRSALPIPQNFETTED